MPSGRTTLRRTYTSAPSSPATASRSPRALRPPRRAPYHPPQQASAEGPRATGALRVHAGMRRSRAATSPIILRWLEPPARRSRRPCLPRARLRTARVRLRRQGGSGRRDAGCHDGRRHHGRPARTGGSTRTRGDDRHRSGAAGRRGVAGRPAQARRRRPARRPLQPGTDRCHPRTRCRRRSARPLARPRTRKSGWSSKRWRRYSATSASRP